MPNASLVELPRSASSTASIKPSAAQLDRLADYQLQLGFHAAAERLAHEAEALRLTGGGRTARGEPR